MKTFQVILAFDVPCYHTVVIEAADETEAQAKAGVLLQDIDSSLFKPDWSAADDYRVADVIDATEVRS